MCGVVPAGFEGADCVEDDTETSAGIDAGSVTAVGEHEWNGQHETSRDDERGGESLHVNNSPHREWFVTSRLPL